MQRKAVNVKVTLLLFFCPFMPPTIVGVNISVSGLDGSFAFDLLLCKPNFISLIIIIETHHSWNRQWNSMQTTPYPSFTPPSPAPPPPWHHPAPRGSDRPVPISPRPSLEAASPPALPPSRSWLRPVFLEACPVYRR